MVSLLQELQICFHNSGLKIFLDGHFMCLYTSMFSNSLMFF
jgi:hypothetical protein